MISGGPGVAVRRMAAALVLALAVACADRATDSFPGTSQPLAPGIEWYRTTDASLVEHAGPIVVTLVRLDPARVLLASALSKGEVLGVETVLDMAIRHGAVAAINGGFFNRENGEPVGLLKVGGELVSDSGATKGVVLIRNPPTGSTEVVFDQLAARLSMTVTGPKGAETVRIDGVDTTRERGRLMLYTPRYYQDTDTAPTGIEWVLDGDPLRVVEMRPGAGSTPIPRSGAVLSYGGTEVPERLAALTPGATVVFETRWRSRNGLSPEELNSADHIVNGAGLLRRDGRLIDDWGAEGLGGSGFVDVRHPRTLIGRDRYGFIWLAAVDGRQPDYSIGMTFADLQRLSDRLELQDALNLDGGGSTTMVIGGQLANKPSDPTGQRLVSDAIIVTLR